MTPPASLDRTHARDRHRVASPTARVMGALALALTLCLTLTLGLASIAAADVPPWPPEPEPAPAPAESDFERGERIGRALGACVCPLCCFVTGAGGAVAAIAISRRKK